jgi:serine/threonine protein kinase
VVSGQWSKTGHHAQPSTHPVVKILDLGLARLQATGQGNARENTYQTSDGPVTMGTVDYQAPEQALDFHKADIRADIYSLGCVAYYLLTGKPPFGSGPLAIKLMRHQQAEPPDLVERRPPTSPPHWQRWTEPACLRTVLRGGDGVSSPPALPFSCPVW